MDTTIRRHSVVSTLANMGWVQHDGGHRAIHTWIGGGRPTALSILWA